MKRSEFNRRKEMRREGYEETFIKSPLGELDYKLSKMSEKLFIMSGGEIIDNHDGTITIKG